MSAQTVLVWNSCARTLAASMLRHVAAVPLPDPKCVREYEAFVDGFVLPDLKEHLYNFDYSVSEWYNHLDRGKQDELDRIKYPIEYKPPTYEMFCKREVQAVDNPRDNYDDCGLPKTRAIAGPKPETKFVLGPVTWALEAVFSKHFEGYCGGKNWQEMESKIQDRYRRGFRYVMQGDGSGFDRTQSHELKYLDRKIYEMVAENVHHVDRDLFLIQSCSRYRKLKGSIFVNGKKVLIGSMKIDATVTSGNPDTTLMNTARMATYCRFMAHQAKVEVEVDAKGDDFAIFYKNESDSALLKAQFEKYWSPKNTNLNKEYGLGLILKFLTVGDLTTYDFCSTHLICDFKEEKFKIVRQWDRIVELGAFSVKALSYSTEVKRQYLEDQAKSMESWAHNMPFYKTYIDFLRSLAQGSKTQLRTSGKDKKKMNHDGHRLNHNQTISNTGYGRDFNYALQLRQSNTVIRDEIVLQFFREKYNLTPTQLSYHNNTLVVNK